MTNGHLSPIALEIGTHAIRAVQLRLGRSRERLSAWARLPRTSEAWTTQEASMALETLRRQGFVGDEVVVVMPAADASACLLEFRGRSAREIDEVTVRGELSRMHRIELGTFECCAWKASGSGRAHANENWLAVCTTHARAEALVKPLDGLGLRIVGVDAGCFALARAAWNDISPSSLGVVVHLARECARFVAVVDAGVVYERVLTGLGWNRIFERAKAQHGLDEALTAELLRAMANQEPRRASVQAGIVRLRPLVDEHMRAITHELRHSLNYLEGGYSSLPLLGISITGEGSAIGGWAKALQAGSGANVRVLGARDTIEGADALDDEVGADLMLAVGLARYPQFEEAVA